MATDLKKVYYVKNNYTDLYNDVTDLFHGLRILKIDGLLGQGKPVNIYTAQWNDEQDEDFLITTIEDNKPVVIRENVDIDITFIIHQKYADPNTDIDVMEEHNGFIHYMTSTDVWVRTEYLGGVEAHCVCLKEYKPTVTKLNRGNQSWMMGTLTLHVLDRVYS